MSTTLSATVSSVTSSVTLESCILDDIHSVHAGGIFRYSRSGLLYGWKTANIESLTLQFGGMNRAKIQELRTWLNFSASYPATITLDNGDVWTGKVMNDPFDSTHESQRNNTFTLIFEGVQS